MKKFLILLVLCWIVNAESGHVIDGDTFDAKVNIWINTYSMERVRVLGVNTPELKGTTKADAEESKKFTLSWLQRGPVMIKTCGRDVFGRLLGTVYRENPYSNLTDELLKAKKGVIFKK